MPRKPGPKVVPTAVLKLRGSKRVGLRTDEPQPPSGRPPCPPWLSREAKMIWTRLLTILAASGMLTRLDGLTLARYCTLYARWQTLEAWLGAHASTVETPGYRDTSYVVAGVHKTLEQLEAAFGLSPAARAALGVALRPTKPAESPPGQDKSRFFTAR
jgi:P27 family predicted phage terminase small subunit